MNGKVTPKDEIATVLYLIEGIMTAQGDCAAILFRKFGTQDQSPIIQTRADDLGTEAIGSGLQRFRIRDGEKGVVVLVETDALALEFPGYKGMTIDPIAGREGEKRTHAKDHGPEYFIANVEIVVGVTRPLPLDDAVARILGRVLGLAGAEVGTRFHGFEDEVDAKAFLTFHSQEVGAGVVFLLETFLLHVGVGPLNRDATLAREGLHPLLVIARSLPQCLLGNGVDAVHVAKKIDDMLRTDE